MTGKLRTLSGLRQRIVSLREERKRLEDSLFRPKKMIRASLSFIPGYCGKEDCRCKRGQPHGPYPYLSERYQGRTRVTYVKKKDLATQLLQETCPISFLGIPLTEPIL